MTWKPWVKSEPGVDLENPTSEILGVWGNRNKVWEFRSNSEEARKTSVGTPGEVWSPKQVWNIQEVRLGDPRGET